MTTHLVIAKMSLVPYNQYQAVAQRIVNTDRAARTIQNAYRAYRAARGFVKSDYGKAAIGLGKKASRNMYRKWGQSTSTRRYRLPNVRKGGFMGMEKKFKNEIFEGTIGQTIGSSLVDPIVSNCLHGIDQGDGEQQRDGRKYTILNVNLRGYVLFGEQAASAVTSDHVRLIVVLDTQTNGAQLTETDVLDNFHGDNDLQTTSFRNLQYTKRFKILKDFTVRKPTTGLGQGSGVNEVKSNACTRYFKININFKKGLEVLSTGTTGTVSTIVDNSIHMMAISVNSNNTLRYVSRVRFVG